MWKKIEIALLILGFLCAFPACGTAPGGEDDGRVTLTLMGRATDMQKLYLQRLFELCEQDGTYRLRVVSVEDEAFEATVQEAFAKGEGPDILFHFNDSALSALNVEGYFSYLDQETWVSDLTDGAKAYCQDSSGRLLGLPFWENSVSGCYYNKTLLSSLGLRPASTQAEFDILCQTLKEMNYVPLCWSLNTGHWMYQFAMDPIFADDPGLLERLNAGEVDYKDIPAVRDMVSWVARAGQEGWFGSGYQNRDWDGLGKAMASGECVMIPIWDTWFYTDFAEGGKYTRDDFALMPVFMGTAPAGTYEGGNLNMMLVNQKGDHVAEALDFLSFCARSEIYNQAFAGISTVNCFRGQTTNIQSAMVTEAMGSVSLYQRTSTAEPKIHGYVQQDVGAAIKELLTGKTDVDGCIALLDAYRKQAADK